MYPTIHSPSLNIHPPLTHPSWRLTFGLDGVGGGAVLVELGLGLGRQVLEVDDEHAGVSLLVLDGAQRRLAQEFGPWNNNRVSR